MIVDDDSLWSFESAIFYSDAASLGKYVAKTTSDGFWYYDRIKETKKGGEHMTKYYRVIKHTTHWEKGAILKKDNDEFYSAVEDVWNRVPSAPSPRHHSGFVEAPENAEFFERVYKSEGERIRFKTAEEIRKVYDRFIPKKKQKKTTA